MYWSEKQRLRRFRRLAHFGLIMALYGAVAACQPVPQPFAHPEKSVNPVVVPSSDFGGVTILPISGLSDDRARSLSTAMAIALLSHGIIAGPDSSNVRSKFLQGAVSQEAAGRGRTRVTVIWDLFDGSGKILGTRKTTRTLRQDDWTNGGQSLLRPLVAASAAEMAKLVRDENGQSAQSRITLHVWPVEGAPAKAAGPLRRAMELALKKRDFYIADALDGAGLVIAGTIELGPDNADPRQIRITWSVLDTAGTELGKLTQRNAIPRQEMEKRWNSLAAVIAENAAGGVSDLVVRLPRNVLRNDEKPAK